MSGGITNFFVSNDYFLVQWKLKLDTLKEDDAYRFKTSAPP